MILKYRYFFYIYIDGIIGEDSLVEIKCPFLAKDCDSYVEALNEKKSITHNKSVYYNIYLKI